MADRIPKDAYAIIIGAMKCGTSSLYSYLEGHPEICPAVGKEPEFFSENQALTLQVDNYSDLWSFKIRFTNTLSRLQQGTRNTLLSRMLLKTFTTTE